MTKTLRLLAVAVCAAWLPLLTQAERGASFDDLLANLKSPNTGTRVSAVAELGKSRRREAVAPLASLVRDPEPKVRMEVVKSLRQLRDLTAVPALLASLQDGDAGIRIEAVGALVELHTERERTTPVGRFLQMFSDEEERASLSLHLQVDAAVHQGLARSLSDEQQDVREQAAFALGILNGRSALPDLARTLADASPEVRAAAASAIGKLGTSADGKALVPLLADESGDVRNRALKALGVLRTREAGPALRELYDTTKRKELGLKVLEALSRVADPSQAELFKQLSQDPDSERRRLAIEGLARISDAALLPAFKKDYQRTRDDELKLAYSFALARLGDAAFLDSVVLCLPSRTLGRRCRDYLVELGSGIAGELYSYLADPDADVRAELCDVLSVVGNAEAIAQLTPLIQDPSAKVQDRANRAIERLRRTDGR